MEQKIEIDANLPVEVTLPAGQWAHVLDALGEAPLKIARPIADAINAKVLEAANPVVEPDKEQADESN